MFIFRLGLSYKKYLWTVLMSLFSITYGRSRDSVVQNTYLNFLQDNFVPYFSDNDVATDIMDSSNLMFALQKDRIPMSVITDAILMMRKHNVPSKEISSYNVLRHSKSLKDVVEKLGKRSSQRKGIASSETDGVCSNICQFCGRVLNKRWSALCLVECESGGNAYDACVTVWSSFTLSLIRS